MSQTITSFYFPTGKNLTTSDKFLWAIYSLFIFFIIYSIYIIIFIKKPTEKKSYTIFLLLYIFSNIILFSFFLGFQYKEINKNEPIFFRSLPDGDEKIRNSIKNFIENAYESNPFILPYNEKGTYIYFTTDFREILLKTKISQHYSQLEDDIDKILKDYPYVPISMIKDDTLISLLNKPFIQLGKTKQSEED
jgi:hypothetical protein